MSIENVNSFRDLFLLDVEIQKKAIESLQTIPATNGVVNRDDPQSQEVLNQFIGRLMEIAEEEGFSFKEEHLRTVAFDYASSGTSLTAKCAQRELRGTHRVHLRFGLPDGHPAKVPCPPEKNSRLAVDDVLQEVIRSFQDPQGAFQGFGECNW
ncbi:MAG: hypothetical protein AAGG02_08715 [Cyanobacteria bacterium P01_H01_bin.15]